RPPPPRPPPRSPPGVGGERVSPPFIEPHAAQLPAQRAHPDAATGLATGHGPSGPMRAGAGPGPIRGPDVKRGSPHRPRHDPRFSETRRDGALPVHPDLFAEMDLSGVDLCTPQTSLLRRA